MQTEFVLWGTAEGDPAWAEQVITETPDKRYLDHAFAWATQNGFHNLRVMESNGEKPDFVGAVRRL